ncbi:DNA ligase [Melia azedarach]|uniref:DNA ligase n=1 Tax=Melia azedarach TaxID=155640 RepID=A0ACC1YD97_MELAZ|nr:DNA ligase [Melia azedarach]
MAYIPPHMRHSKDPQVPSPTPERLVHQFNRNLRLGSHKHNADRSGKIVYADNAISRWFAVELDEDGHFPLSLHLEPISVESVEQRRGEKPLVLVNNNPAKDNDEVGENTSRSTWEFVAENVWPDILSACKMVSNLMEEKPTLVVRFGQVLFHGSKSLSSETARKSQVAETILRQLQRSFRTNVPETFVEKITSGAVPKIGADFEEEKDIYHIKLSDSASPQSTVSCKCSVREDQELELYKVELNPVRHVVVDISCLDKNVDLRLALYTKKILADMTDDEMHIIRNLINSAILDPEVKGGLRWPLGKANSGDRFTVIGVWHTKFRSYKNSSLRLKVRHADRFDFKTATGEAAVEIALKLKRVVSEIQEEKVDTDSTYNVFKDNLKLIWDHFLSCEQVFT